MSSTAAQQAAYRKKYPTKNRSSHLRRTYGISLEDYDAILLKQNGNCAVCKRPAGQFKVNLSVDHDHSTGEIRGILCPYCNRMVIGRFRRDKGLELLKNAVEYLIGPYTGWIVPPKVKKRKKRGKNPSNRTR